MNCAKRRIAIKALAAVLLGASAGMVLAAQVAGTIVNLSGPLMVRKADGSVKVLGLKSEVEQGDTLVSEKNTYAQIRFIDNSEMTLRPGTAFKIEAFAYDSAKPEADSATFSLLQGGLRSLTGLLGKRNKEKFALKTPIATIGVRGTTFIAQLVPVTGAAPVSQPDGSALAPGLHVFVVDGAIMLSNAGGSMNFSSGQFGFTASRQQPPMIVPGNPALTFSPPVAFRMAPQAQAASGMARPQTVDCEVR